MALEAFHHLLVEGIGLACHPKRAVIHITPGAARHLAQFGWIELAVLKTVELAGGGEGDMVDIHVEAHADGIGGNDVIDIARLVEGDLGVAGSGAKRPQNHSGATTVAADQFGRRIDHVGREGDDGRAAGQPGDLLLPGIEQLRKAWPGDEIGLGQQFFENGAHGGSTQQHGFVAAPAVQHPVGEDVTALEIGAKLHLVDCQEGHIDIGWHGLDRADPIAGIDGDDLFLAGDQRHCGIAGL